MQKSKEASALGLVPSLTTCKLSGKKRYHSVPCVCIDVRGKIPEGANVPTEQIDHTLFVETVVVACTASGLGIVKSVNESRPPVATVQPQTDGPNPSYMAGPNSSQIYLIPHAKKKYQLPKLSKKTQLGDPSFRNCEEPLASERICDAHKAKTPRFLVARFDKFGGKTVWLGVAISVMYVPARVAGSVWPPWLQPGAAGRLDGATSS